MKQVVLAVVSQLQRRGAIIPDNPTMIDEIVTDLMPEAEQLLVVRTPKEDVRAKATVNR